MRSGQITPQRSEPWRLDDFLALQPDGDGWLAQAPSSWSPKAPAHGGILFGLAITAMRRRLLREEAATAHPDLLTATAHFPRKTMPGAVRAGADLIRSGRSHSTVQSSLHQNDQETVRVLGVFGTLPPGDPETDLTPPPLPTPEECFRIHDVRRDPDDHGDYPSSLDVRIDPEVGWPHGARTGKQEVNGWCRLADDRPHDAASLALLADGFPPPIFDAFPVRSVPTLELTVHIRARPSSSWLQGRFTTRAINRPYVEEDGFLWDTDGRLVVMSRQLALADIPTEQDGAA